MSKNLVLFLVFIMMLIGTSLMAQCNNGNDCGNCLTAHQFESLADAMKNLRNLRWDMQASFDTIDYMVSTIKRMKFQPNCEPMAQEMLFNFEKARFYMVQREWSSVTTYYKAASRIFKTLYKTHTGNDFS